VPPVPVPRDTPLHGLRRVASPLLLEELLLDDPDELGVRVGRLNVRVRSPVDEVAGFLNVVPLSPLGLLAGGVRWKDRLWVPETDPLPESPWSPVVTGGLGLSTGGFGLGLSFTGGLGLGLLFHGGLNTGGLGFGLSFTGGVGFGSFTGGVGFGSSFAGGGLLSTGGFGSSTGGFGGWCGQLWSLSLLLSSWLLFPSLL
jgi:hypothetical protein